MLLSYSDIKEPVRKCCRKEFETCAGRHCGSNCNYFLVLLGTVNYCLAEYIGIALRGVFFDEFAGVFVEFADAVEFFGRLFRRFIALALGSSNVNNNRLRHLVLDTPEYILHCLNIVTVNGAEISKAQDFKHCTLNYRGL